MKNMIHWYLRQQYFCFRIHTIPIQIHFLFIRIQVLKYISSIVVDKKFLFFCVKIQVNICALSFVKINNSRSIINGGLGFFP